MQDVIPWFIIDTIDKLERNFQIGKHHLISQRDNGIYGCSVYQTLISCPTSNRHTIIYIIEILMYYNEKQLHVQMYLSMNFLFNYIFLFNSIDCGPEKVSVKNDFQYLITWIYPLTFCICLILCWSDYDSNTNCTNIDCDGLKNILIKDTDGTFIGHPGTILPGHYKDECDIIPNEMLTTVDGQKLDIKDVAQHRGKYNNAIEQVTSELQFLGLLKRRSRRQGYINLILVALELNIVLLRIYEYLFLLF